MSALEWQHQQLGPVHVKATCGPYELTAYKGEAYVCIATLDRRHVDVATVPARTLTEAKRFALEAALADCRYTAERLERALAALDEVTP
jgi:hypothetical protein